MYLIFDTETTGVNKSSDRVIQLAWLLVAASGKELRRQNFLIKPSGFEIPSSAEKIHGISTAVASRFGVELRQALLEFSRDVEECRAVVVHNISFDLGMLRPEFDRENIKRRLDEKSMICTMRASTSWCRLPKLDGRPGYKWPKLDELHYRLFGTYFDNAHDALNDVQATRDCFFELIKRKIVLDPIDAGDQSLNEPQIQRRRRVDRETTKGSVEGNVSQGGIDRKFKKPDVKYTPQNSAPSSKLRVRSNSGTNAGIGEFRTVSLRCKQCGENFSVTMRRYENLTFCPRCHSSVASDVT